MAEFVKIGEAYEDKDATKFARRLKTEGVNVWVGPPKMKKGCKMKFRGIYKKK